MASCHHHPPAPPLIAASSDPKRERASSATLLDEREGRETMPESTRSLRHLAIEDDCANVVQCVEVVPRYLQIVRANHLCHELKTGGVGVQLRMVILDDEDGSRPAVHA